MTGSLVVGFAHKRSVCNLWAQPEVFTICEDFRATLLAPTNAGGTAKRASACVKRTFSYCDSTLIPPTGQKLQLAVVIVRCVQIGVRGFAERCLVAYSFVRYWTPQQVNARPAPKYRSEGCLLAYSFVRYWTPQQVNARRTEGSTVSLALFLVPPLFAQLDRRLDFHAVGVIGVESR